MYKRQAQYIAIFLACAGVIGLGFVEANEDDDLRAARQEASNYKYAKSWLALALPIAYCILDAAGTFADDLVLETLNEDSANEIAEKVEEEYPDVEVEVHYGGQPIYYYVISVE